MLKKKNLLFAFIVLLIISLFSYIIPFAKAGIITDSGSTTVTGLVPGTPPPTPPTITEPAAGQTFDVKNITVAGSCLSGLVVKIFSNSIFVGSALCSGSNNYQLNVDLFEGRNDLVGRQYDFASQASPDSETITVYYVPPSPAPVLPPATNQPSQTANFQLGINYDYTVQGVFVGEPFRLPIQIYGGQPPYAISIDWGDGNTSVYSRSSNEKFTAEHIYKKSGAYTVVIRVSDELGNTSYLQFVIFVNDKNSNPIAKFISNNLPGGSSLPITTIATAFLLATGLIAFIGGIRYERHLLQPRRSKKIPNNK